ncbi:MAG: hypothetical protein ACI4II_05975 [Acutalibacteraceae bacterium]
MKKILSFITVILMAISLSACNGSDNSGDFNYYKYDSAADSLTGWDTKLLADVGLGALHKPDGTQLLSADGDSTSDVLIFLVNSDGESDIERDLYYNVVKEIKAIIERDDKFISENKGYDEETASEYNEICYEYGDKNYAVYIAYYENELTEEYYTPACMGISVTSYKSSSEAASD